MGNMRACKRVLKTNDVSIFQLSATQYKLTRNNQAEVKRQFKTHYTLHTPHLTSVVWLQLKHRKKAIFRSGMMAEQRVTIPFTHSNCSMSCDTAE